LGSSFLNLFRQVLVSVLLGLAMKPHDLRPVEDVELPEVPGTAVHLRHVPDVRSLVVQRPRQAHVEVGSEDRADEPAEDELG
jgi:hypothetical protein